MPKQILVPLDPSPYTASAQSYACEIAAQHGAEVTALLMIDEPGIHESVGPVSPGVFYLTQKAERRMQAEAHDRLQDLLRGFEATCQEYGIAHGHVERIGEPAEIIAQVSAYFDLIVMGLRTYYHFQTSDDPGRTLSRLLGQLYTPLFAVPESHRPIGATLETVIAFDGSPGAIRSMRQFSQYLEGKDLDILVLMADESKDDADAVLRAAELYLKRHGFDRVRTDWTPGSIREALDGRFLSEAEVIVVGIHSKKGLFGSHVGSLTDHLISEATIPVFIGQ
jgi:nucleotide-binding universal stress UspA family protein